MKPYIALVTITYDSVDQQLIQHPNDVAVGFIPAHSDRMLWVCYWYYQIETLKGILYHETSN